MEENAGRVLKISVTLEEDILKAEKVRRKINAGRRQLRRLGSDLALLSRKEFFGTIKSPSNEVHFVTVNLDLLSADEKALLRKTLYDPAEVDRELDELDEVLKRPGLALRGDKGWPANSARERPVHRGSTDIGFWGGLIIGDN